MKPETLKRLLFSKRLYTHALEHTTTSSEMGRFFAILHLDGAIELILKTLADEKGVQANNRQDTNLKNLWDAINQKIGGTSLSLKQQIFAVHDQRNLSQHAGSIPSDTDITRYTVYVHDFLESVCKNFFGLKFDSLALSDLIENEHYRQMLKEAETFRHETKTEEYLKKISGVFYLLFKESKTGVHEVDHELEQLKGRVKNLYGGTVNIYGELKEVHKRIDSLEEFLEEFTVVVVDELKALSLGLDYAEYKKFRSLVPYCSGVALRNSNSGANLEFCYGTLPKLDKGYTEQELDFVLNFVVDCALKLGELDQIKSPDYTKLSWSLSNFL